VALLGRARPQNRRLTESTVWPYQPITGVGSRFANTGTNGTTQLSVSPTAVGDLLVLVSGINTSGITVSSVSGGGVSSWARAAGPFQMTTAATRNLEIWFGRITTAGAATVTITPSASISGIRSDLIAQQFHSPSGVSAVWAVDAGQGGGQNNTGSSTSIAFPTLTPSTNDLYFGYGVTGTSTSGATAGYTYQTDPNSNPIIYNGGVLAPQSPTVTQTSSNSGSIAVLFRDTAPDFTVYDKTGGCGGSSGPGGAKTVVSPIGGTFIEDVNAVVGTTTTTTGTFVAAPTDGDLAYCYAVNKPSTVTPPAPAGWTQISSVVVGTGTDGVGTGPVRITVWHQVVAGTFTSPTVTNPAGSVIAAGIAYIRPNAALAGTTGVGHTTTSAQDLVDDATWSLTGGADLGVIDKDLVLTVDGWSNNIASAASLGSLSGPGLTVGSSSELTDTQLNVGNRGQMVANLFWSITGQSTGAQTHAQTLNAAMTNRTGGTLFVRIRPLGQPLAVIYTKTGGSGGAGAPGGVETVQNPVTSTKAGAGVAVGAPGGAKTVVRVATLVASYKVEANAADNTTLTTPSFTPAAGELLVVKAGNGDVRGTFAVNPTDTQDLEWTRQQSFFSGTNQSAAQVNTARVRTATAMTVSLAMSGSPYYHSMIVERWAWGGLHPTTPSVAVPTTGTGAPSATVTTVGTESAITWVNADWVPANPSSRAYRSGATEDGLQYTAGIIAVYYAWQRASVNGAQSIGLTAPGGQTWSMVGVELLTKVSATPTATAPADVTGWAVNTALALTGTDTDPDIDTRRWSIVSGPVGAGTTLARVAGLSWTPTVAGSYVLRYEVANSGGSGFDDIAVQVVTIFAKAGAGAGVGAPGGAKAVTTSKAGAGAGVGAPGGAKVRTTATTTSKTGTAAGVGAPGGAKTVQGAVTTAKAGTAAGVGAPGGAKVRITATTTAKTGTAAGVGAPGGGKAVQNPVTTAKAGTAAAAGAPGGVKALLTATTTAKTGAGAAVGAPGGAKSVVSGAAIVKTGTAAAVAAAGGAKAVQNPITTSKAGTGAAVGAPGGAKVRITATTYTKAGTSATAGAPGGVKTFVPAGVIVKTGAGVAAGAPGGAKLVVSLFIVKTGTAVAVGAPGGVKSLAAPGQVVKAGAAAAPGAPGGAKTVTHPATQAKAGTAAAVGVPGGNRSVDRARTGTAVAVAAPGGTKQVGGGATVTKAGTAAAVAAPGGAQTVTHPATVVKAGTGAAAGAPSGGKSIAGAGQVVKAGTAAAVGAPGGVRTRTAQKTGTAAAVAAPGGARTVAGPGTIVKAGTAAAVAVGAGTETVAHAAVVVKAGTAAGAAAPGGAKTVQTPQQTVKSGAAAAAGAPGGARSLTSPGLVVKSGAGVTAVVAGGGRVRVLGRTGAAVAVGAPGGAKTLSGAGAIVKTGSGVAAGAPGGARSAVLVKAGTAAVVVVARGARAGVLNKAGSAVAAGVGSGLKIFAPHTVHTKTGAGVCSVVGSGTRIRWLLRTGTAAGRPVVSGWAYVNPRRKTGAAAARGAPGGQLTLHEFVQFGRVSGWDPTGPTAVGVLIGLPGVVEAPIRVPAVVGGASPPGSSAVVDHTGAVADVVFWDGSDG
jgi:hypothetical protein